MRCLPAENKKEENMCDIDDVTLPVLNAYLEKRGWHCLENIEIDLPIFVWKHPKVGGMALRVPKNTELADYRAAMKRVVKDLAAAGRRAENEVLQDICRQGGAGIQPPVMPEPETENLSPV